MPLFECSKCGCAENTALCDFWTQFQEERPPLCSQCDPAIAKWHGEFPKKPAAEIARAEMHTNPTGQWLWWDGSEYDHITPARWLSQHQQRTRVPRPYHVRIQTPKGRQRPILYERSNWQPADLASAYHELVCIIGAEHAALIRDAMERFATSPTTSQKGGSLTLPNGTYATWKMWRSEGERTQ